MNRQTAGRVCPIDYRLSAADFAAAPVHEVDVLYLAGGLYGNPFALTAIEQLLSAEMATAQLCLNGDFHWFDARSDWFADIEQRTRLYHRTRGNVETEISRGGNTDAGCGCAYPDSVDEDDVQRSNQIMSLLAASAGTAFSDREVNALGSLAPIGRYRVGDMQVGVTHGDEQSMAGWSFAHDQIERSWRDGLGQRMREMGLNIFASSHTCLPVASLSPDGQQFVINNGSAGMANFGCTTHGLITRIAPVDLSPPIRPLFAYQMGQVQISALPVHFGLTQWLALFDAVWPAGSAAQISYRKRITEGPDFSVGQAMQFPQIKQMKDAA